MPDSIDVLINSARSKAAEAEALAQKILTAGRVTEEEAARFAALTEEATSAAVKAAAGSSSSSAREETERAALADPNMRALLGLEVPIPAGRKATPWGDAMVKANSPGGCGFKELLPSGSVAVAVPAPPVVELGRPVRSVLSLIPRERTTGGVYAYLRQTGRTNAAAPVAAGAVKPTSVYGLERVQDEVATIAHVSEQIPTRYLSDATVLREFMETEMRLGLEPRPTTGP